MVSEELVEVLQDALVQAPLVSAHVLRLGDAVLQLAREQADFDLRFRVQLAMPLPDNQIKVLIENEVYLQGVRNA